MVQRPGDDERSGKELLANPEVRAGLSRRRSSLSRTGRRASCAQRAIGYSHARGSFENARYSLRRTDYLGVLPGDDPDRRLDRLAHRQGRRRQLGRDLAECRVYTLLLGVAVRFIHHALYDGTMFTLQYYVVDTVYLMVVRSSASATPAPARWRQGTIGSMRKSGPFGWKKKSVLTSFHPL